MFQIVNPADVVDDDDYYEMAQLSAPNEQPYAKPAKELDITALLVNASPIG